MTKVKATSELDRKVAALANELFSTYANLSPDGSIKNKKVDDNPGKVIPFVVGNPFITHNHFAPLMHYYAAKHGLRVEEYKYVSGKYVSSVTVTETRENQGAACRYCFGSGRVLNPDVPLETLSCETCKGDGTIAPSEVIFPGGMGKCEICGSEAIGTDPAGARVCASCWADRRFFVKSASALADLIKEKGADSLPADILLPYAELATEEQDSKTLELCSPWLATHMMQWRGFNVLKRTYRRTPDGREIAFMLIDAMGTGLPSRWVAVDARDRLEAKPCVFQIQVYDYNPGPEAARYTFDAISGVMTRPIGGRGMECRFSLSHNGKTSISTVGTGFSADEARLYAELITYAANYLENVAASLSIKKG